MSENLTLHGCVLTSMPMGENDRRILLLTRERGLVSAFARGARRATNPLGAATNPFTFGEFDAYEGRSSYTVVSAKITTYFTELLTDLDNVYYGSYFVEIAEYYGEPGVDEKDRLNLLYVALRALERGAMPKKLVRRIYELRTLFINGEYPDMFSCTVSGSREHLTHFSIKERGMVSRENVDPNDLSLIPVSQSLLYVMQYVLTSPLEKLFAFTVSDQTVEEFDRLMTLYQNRWSEHRYKSEEFLS